VKVPLKGTTEADRTAALAEATRAVAVRVSGRRDAAGNATVAAAALDGSFSATLAAGSGDELSVFAVEPATSNAGSKPVTVFVP
jgi:hypothetical protein